MVLWAFSPWCGGCSFHATECRRMGIHGIQTNKTRQGEGAGTNVHFEEKPHKEHTVVSLAARSSTQQLNASFYLALRLCRLSIAPLRQSPVTLNNRTLTSLAGCSLLLCNYCTHPLICSHISVDEVQISALVIFPFCMRRQTAN